MTIYSLPIRKLADEVHSLAKEYKELDMDIAYQLFKISQELHDLARSIELSKKVVV